MDLLRIAPRHLLRHALRTLLTLGSLTVAIFMLCVLRSLVTTLEASAQSQGSQRLWVQSAVSLFVEMPSWYPERIAGVEGVESVARWQWFGGYYQDPSNFFAQFAVDPEKVLDLYPELDLVEGTSEAFLSGRTTCLALMRRGGHVPRAGPCGPPHCRCHRARHQCRPHWCGVGKPSPRTHS